MSNVLLEASACGRPVITTNRPGCGETVEDGVNGYVVPIQDEEAVLIAVKRFLEMNDGDRKRMGEEGRKKMEREFDRSHIIETYINELERMMCKGGTDQ